MKNDRNDSTPADESASGLCRITYIGEQTKIVPSVSFVTHWDLLSSPVATQVRHANDQLHPGTIALCSPRELDGIHRIVQPYLTKRAAGNAMECLAILIHRISAQGTPSAAETVITRDEAREFLEMIEGALHEQNAYAREALARIRLQLPPKK